LHFNAAACNRNPFRLWLGADIDHMRLTVGVKVG
jgi:hypothetical protein